MFLGFCFYFSPEQSCWLPAWNFEEDRDAKVHKRLSEVNDTLPGKVDGHGANSNVCFVLHKLLPRMIGIKQQILTQKKVNVHLDQSIPLARGQVQSTVVVVIHQLNVVIESDLE